MRYILAVALLALAACGSSDPSPTADADASSEPGDDGPAVDASTDTGIDVPAPLCIEGTVRACACPAGRKGRERCEGATVGYGACDCGTPDAGPVAMDAGAEDVPRVVDVLAGDALPAGCVSTTVGNCCGVACPMPANGAAGCFAGRCGIARCDPDFGDCDGNAANGCEVNLQAVAAHCGACGTPCAEGRGCVTGACVECAAGTTLCGGTCVDTRTSVAACGSCGVVCPMRPRSNASCVAGVCVNTCFSGFADCNGTAADGCEADLSYNAQHCGGCRRACGPGLRCDRGACVRG